MREATTILFWVPSAKQKCNFIHCVARGGRLHWKRANGTRIERERRTPTSSATVSCVALRTCVLTSLPSERNGGAHFQNMSCSALSFGTLAVGTPRANLGLHRHSRTRIAVRPASRVLVETPAARGCVNAINVTDATSLTHCVQDSAGDEGSSYFRYSFTSEAPGGTSAYFEADGVKLYISDGGIAASTCPESKPTQTSAILGANLHSPSAPDAAEDVAPSPGAVAGDHQDAGANVVTDEADESSPPPTDENISEVHVPPVVFAAATSAMRHCVMRTSGTVCLYAFDEYPPTNAGVPAFEVAAVKVYVDAGDLRVEPTPESEKETTATEVVDASAPVPPVSEPVAPTPPAAVSSASAVTSCAISGVSGEGAGKSGAAVFEHGVGIAAWQGLEVGYEMDVVLEVPAPVVAVEETAVAEPVPVASGRKKVWMAEPLDSRPREGVRQMTSGAAVFGNGVGIASFREANLDLPGVEAESPSASESHEVPERRPGLKSARSPGSGVAGFTYAGTGSATFKRFSPAKSGAPDAPEASTDEDEEKPPENALTVTLWATCVAILAFKLLISPA